MGERNKEKKLTSVSSMAVGKSNMKMLDAFRTMLKQRGYSEKAVKEIWKWYDS